MNASRTLIIGDVHGCLTEFDALLRLVEYRPGDRLILCGDLVDKGPEPAAVVRRAMELNAECVMGNHEENHLRFNAHQITENARDKKNPMAPRMRYDNFRLVQETMTQREWDWVAGLPNFIHIDERWTVVHAGCMPGIAVEEQEQKHLLRLRDIDTVTGKMVGVFEEKKHPERLHWSRLWKGPRSIVYGHIVRTLGAVARCAATGHGAENMVRMQITGEDAHTIGIDTGCVYGGKLTAMIMSSGWIEFASVPATGKWAEFFKENDE